MLWNGIRKMVRRSARVLKRDGPPSIDRTEGLINAPRPPKRVNRSNYRNFYQAMNMNNQRAGPPVDIGWREGGLSQYNIAMRKYKNDHKNWVNTYGRTQRRDGPTDPVNPSQYLEPQYIDGRYGSTNTPLTDAYTVLTPIYQKNLDEVTAFPITLSDHLLTNGERYIPSLSSLAMLAVNQDPDALRQFGKNRGVLAEEISVSGDGRDHILNYR